MANKRFWLGMLVMVLVFGMMVVGCDNGLKNANTDPKTIIVTGIPDEYAVASYNYYITVSDPTKTGTVALSLSGVLSNAEVTIDLYTTKPVEGGITASDTRWTGSGTFRVTFTIASDSGGTRKYHQGSTLNISINEAVTTIPYDQFSSWYDY